MQNKRRLILIILIALVLLCLVGVVTYNTFFRPGGGQPQIAQEQATPAPTEPPSAEEPTATPTQVVEPTQEPTAVPTLAAAGGANDNTSGGQPTDTPTTTPPTATPLPVTQIVETVVITEVGELLQNGGFERGFADNGVGTGWEAFSTDGAAVNFSAESAGVFIHGGQAAQRISIDKAFQPNQYGGIYQTVEVLPGEVYTLTVYGQIRSGFGNVDASSYGYRMQAALDQSGGANWQTITPTAWIELPWPEQALDEAAPAFSEFSTQFVAESEQLKLFVRAWNKWPDGNLGEYTLDDLSLVGPTAVRTETVVKTLTAPGAQATAPAGGEEMIDKPLPTTGYGDDTNLFADARFWGALLVLLLLTGGAFYRARWRW